MNTLASDTQDLAGHLANKCARMLEDAIIRYLVSKKKTDISSIMCYVNSRGLDNWWEYRYNGERMFAFKIILEGSSVKAQITDLYD